MSRRTLLILVVILGAAIFLIVRPQSPSSGVMTPAASPEESGLNEPAKQPAAESPTPRPSATPLAEQTGSGSASTAAPVSAEVQAAFDNARVQALSSIPTQSELQKLNSEQVHFTPPAVINAAVQVAKVSELIDRNPGLSEKGLAFYKECAENEASSTTSRASCLVEFDLLKSKSSSKIPQPNVDSNLRALAKKSPR